MAAPLPFGHPLIQQASQHDYLADDPGSWGWMGPYLGRVQSCLLHFFLIFDDGAIILGFCGPP